MNAFTALRRWLRRLAERLGLIQPPPPPPELPWIGASRELEKMFKQMEKPR